MPLPDGFLAALAPLLGRGGLLTGAAEREAYAWDNTGLRHLPQAVALAENHTQVAAVLRHCHGARVPVVPRGAGTGNVGGALALAEGVVLSTQRMNRILEINPRDRLAVVEPGVINSDLQAALLPHGLCWPPDPSSARSCSIGGNLAMCAAGPRAVRFGVTRDWVLGLTAVLPDGTVIKTGGRTSKGVVGYDLTRLLVGSEGTLAVVTEAVLRLAPRPEDSRLLRAVFANVDQAARAVSALMEAEPVPCAIEFLDPGSLGLLRHGGEVAIPEGASAMLLLEVCGSAGEVAAAARVVAERLAVFLPLELELAESEEAAARVWQARSALSPALKRLAPRRVNEDVVVPVSRLPELVSFLDEISRQWSIPVVSFGHAGNGNLHVNLLVDPAKPGEMDKIPGALSMLFDRVLALGGTLSGEHGVGMQKKAFISREIDPATLALQRRLKNVFDPNGILNPGKIFPD